MLRGFDEIGLSLSYQSEGIGELLSSKIHERQAELEMLRDTTLLFFKYEGELKRFLVNRDVYFRNNDTHQNDRDLACQLLFTANRQIHLDFLRQKLLSHELYSEAALLLQRPAS